MSYACCEALLMIEEPGDIYGRARRTRSKFEITFVLNA